MTLALPTYDGTAETLQFILDLIAQAIPNSGVPLGSVVPVATTNLATPSVTTAWTTVDVSSYVPAHARSAVLYVNVGGTRSASSGSYATNSVQFRRDSTLTNVIAQVEYKFSNPTATANVGGGIASQVIVPLLNRSFQYQYVVGLDGSNGASISIQGYTI